MCIKIRLHSIIPQSEVNGPGKRFAIWTQGCNRNCEGCFNPKSHSFDGGYEIEVDDLFKQIIDQHGIEGVSISGGEPFFQVKPLYILLKKIKNETDLSVTIFTGYSLNGSIKNSILNELLQYIDILKAGPYDKKLKTNEPLLPSSNQKIYFLTNKYDYNDLNIANVEMIIEKSGNITQTGYSNFIDV